MKQLLIILTGTLLLAACYPKRLTTASFPENFTVREISKDSAEIYKKNYLDDPKFKIDFRQGMYIPVKIIDAIRTEEGINGIMVYYGKSPEYKSPVFILTGTKDILNYKSRSANSAPFAEKAYLVYYPCPTHCSN
ncbi:hypothetical protein [Flavihumibacter fluvii]|uniref:hypothetical protein n=1 Tax=Flavihumibacter fluvii TaxID=2838157 RepID=UPI001BDEBE90|nr:hypothetical protein [Flavihumibacter fluvii]ULQ53108.1 hypothetical protein KJS93_02100 [Flavihumibacter fluvii]